MHGSKKIGIGNSCDTQLNAQAVIVEYRCINRSPAFFFLFNDYKFLDISLITLRIRSDATMWVDNVDAVRVWILLILLSEEV